jgi:glycosyltransferase involved in cell wall biosynthesis
MRADQLVSVVMPAFNAESVIQESVLSVLRQTYSRLELIIVDDGSTDSTSQILKTVQDPRVTVRYQENKGAASARNHAMRLVKGDLIQFLDADDILSNDKIERQVTALVSSPPGTIASCPWAHFTSDTKAAVIDQEPVWSVTDPTQWLIESLSGAGMMQTASWLIPREIAEVVGPWNESLTLHDDGEYFTRILLASRRNAFVPEAIVFYRGANSSLSRRRSAKDLESAFLVCELRRQHLLGKLDSPASRKAVATQYAQFVYEHGRTAPDLARSAIDTIHALGVKPNVYAGGHGFRFLSGLIGFHGAVRLRSAIGGLIG